MYIWLMYKKISFPLMIFLIEQIHWVFQNRMRTINLQKLLLIIVCNDSHSWDKVFKNGPSKICERQPVKNFTWSILEYFVPVILPSTESFLLVITFLITNIHLYCFSRFYPALWVTLLKMCLRKAPCIAKSHCTKNEVFH